MSRLSVSDVTRIVHAYNKNYAYFKKLCDSAGIKAPLAIQGSDGVRFVLNNCHTELANTIRVFMEYFIPIKCMSCAQADILTDDPYLRQLKYGHLVSRISLIPILQTADWEAAEISLPLVKNTTNTIQTIYMKSFLIKGVKSERPLVPQDGIFAYLHPGNSLEIKNIKVAIGSVTTSGAAYSMSGRVGMEVLDQEDGVSCMNSTPVVYALTITPQRYGSAERIIASAFEIMLERVTTILKLCKEYKQNIFTDKIDLIGYDTKFDVLLKGETLAFGNLLCRYIYNADQSIERCHCEEMDTYSLGVTLTIIHVDPPAILGKALGMLSVDLQAIYTQLKASM